MKTVLKTMMTVLALSTLACSAFAKQEKADSATLQMISKLARNCPEQLVAALEQSPEILTAEQSESVNAAGKKIYSTTLSTGVIQAYFPMPASTPPEVLAVLTLVETPYDLQPADGFRAKAECKIELK